MYADVFTFGGGGVGGENYDLPQRLAGAKRGPGGVRAAQQEAPIEFGVGRDPDATTGRQEKKIILMFHKNRRVCSREWH